MAGEWKRSGSTKAVICKKLQTLEGASLEQARKVVDYIFERHRDKVTPPVQPIYTIPDEVFEQSLGCYGKNQFARLLMQNFGQEIALSLLQRFQIGTSNHWPGACVFWYIDEQNRKRGGQIKLFDDDWHTIKFVNQNGKRQSKISWVHFALIRRCQINMTPIPKWLMAYEQHAERSPCLFGLPQLLTAPIDKQIALVEAPKTAVICAYYFPNFIWLAVGALSYLNADRLAPLRERRIVLFPDLNGYTLWSKRVKDLQAKGFSIVVSDFLEREATDEQRQLGSDLADLLLNEPKC